RGAPCRRTLGAPRAPRRAALPRSREPRASSAHCRLVSGARRLRPRARAGRPLPRDAAPGGGELSHRGHRRLGERRPRRRRSLARARSVLLFETVLENRAAAPVSGALALSVNGRAMLPVPVDLPPGPSIVATPFRVPARGEYLVEARLLLPAALPAPGPVTSAI